MESSSGRRERTVDHEETGDAQNLQPLIRHGQRRLAFKPLSLCLIGIYALTIFFGGFFLVRYARDFYATSRDPIAPGVAQARPVDNARPRTTSLVSIEIKNMKFDPAMLEVNSGDVVEWKNDDLTPHTATSADFDSGSIEPEKSWRRAFTERGNFPYSCTFHPEMKAAILVK